MFSGEYSLYNPNRYAEQSYANECRIDANEQTAPLQCYEGAVELEVVILEVAANSFDGKDSKNFAISNVLEPNFSMSQVPIFPLQGKDFPGRAPFFIEKQIKFDQRGLLSRI